MDNGESQAPTAKISGDYTRRLAVVAIACVGWGIASVYDGLVRYPDHNRKYAKYMEFADTKETDTTWKDKWKSHARAQGWDVGTPKHHSELDIKMQFVMAIICLPIGLATAVLLFRNRNLSFAAGTEGLSGWGNDVIPYSAITEIDKALWDSKGIAIAWATSEGRRRKVPLDDWKWVGMEAILNVVESRMGGEPDESADAE